MFAAKTDKQTANEPQPVSTAPPSDNWDEDVIEKQTTRKLWQGLDGLSVLSFGVVIPVLLIVINCVSAPKRMTLVILNHPLETLAEILLTLSIPLMNYLVWSALCKNDARFSLRRGIALGAAIGSSFIVAFTCAAGMVAGCQELESTIGTGFTTGFGFMGVLSALAGACGIYLVNRVRLTKDFARSRSRVVSYTIAGAILSVMTFIGAEARPWCIRIAERMAVANSPADRMNGLQWLRQLNPERELRMECSDPRAAGLAGLFFPLKSTTQHQLYFALTGKPYSFRDSSNTNLSSLPDDYLSRHVVGDKVKGLILTRTAMTGIVHPDSLTSTVNWTMVFKNDSAIPQEARAEMKVPAGAVVTGLTLWTNGEPQAATFVASGKADGVSNWVQADHSSPAMITDLGKGRVLLHCYPVPQEEELKVSVTLVAPLNPDGAKAASLTLPRFIATNFDMEGEHVLRLRSPMRLTSSLDGIKEGSNPSGGKLLTGKLKTDLLTSSDFMVTAVRPELREPIAMLDKLSMALHQQDMIRQRQENERQAESLEHAQPVMVMVDGSRNVERQVDDLNRAIEAKDRERSKKLTVLPVKPEYVIQSIRRVAAVAPRHLVVVLDGSVTLKQYAGELAEALGKVPASVPVSLIFASQEQEKLMEPAALEQGLKEMKNIRFIGGQDNLKAVVKGAELAGESQDGALLWIHGPQPVLNREIYIMAPYEATPHFYELALDSGDTDTVEFFKNHSEIGPFLHVPRNGSIAADLDRFFSRWHPDSADYMVDVSQTAQRPSDAVVVPDQQSKELLALHANEEVLQLIAHRQSGSAARLAMTYGLVTPVSSALVVSGGQGTVDSAGGPFGNQSSRPSIQGATNGTIGPQDGDATVVQGINTAGTVRVNNLANLEAMFNIIANLMEIGGTIIGATILLHGLFVRVALSNFMGTGIELTPTKRIAAGITLILLGLAMPGLISWFVGSARDANLFS